MALDANGQICCKVVHTESGRVFVRRINTIVVQLADGRVYYLRGRDLPDSISLYTGHPYQGEPLARVLMEPERVKGTPLLADRRNWISLRDVFFWVLGMYSISLVSSIATAIVPLLR